MTGEKKDDAKSDDLPDTISDDQLDDIDGGLFLNTLNVSGASADTITGFGVSDETITAVSAPETIVGMTGKDFLRKRPGRTS